MGQYHMPVNIDKQEYLNPHILGAGLKMVEIIWNTGMPAAMTVLTSCSHMRVGGDVLMSDEALLKVAGRWAGDRIVFVGDYTEPGDPGTESLWLQAQARSAGGDTHLWNFITSAYTDISLAVREVLMQDNSISDDIGESYASTDNSTSLHDLTHYRVSSNDTQEV